MIEPLLNAPRLLACLLMLLGLGACGFLAHDKKVIDFNAQADALMASNDVSSAHASLLRTQNPRIAGEMVYLKQTALPERLMQPLSFLSRGNEGLLNILEDLSKLIGLPIKTIEIGPSMAGSTSSGPGSGTNLSRAFGGNTLPLSYPNAMAPPWGSTLESNNAALNFEHKGSAKALLDELAAKANVSWRFNPLSQSLEFFRFETKTFSVFLPAGMKSVSAGISLTGVSATGGSNGLSGGALSSTQGASGAGNVSVTQSLSINPWGSIMEGVKAILNEGHASSDLSSNSSNGAFNTSNHASSTSMVGALAGGVSAGQNGPSTFSGASAIANPELAMITVTARPGLLLRVERYIDSINERFAHNVMIDVKIFSVALDAQNSLGFGLNMLYSKLGQLGANVSTPSPLRAGVDTPGIVTLSPSAGASNWSGSTLVAQALSQWGKVSLQRQGQVLAVNGQPSPIQVANEISYVASSSTTSSANVGAVITQNTGSKVVGFTANFLPLILGDNRILLSYQMQISSLASPLTPNAQGIQTPNVASQSLQQQAFLNDGQAIVLFGYDEQRAGVDSATTFGGYSNSNSQSRQMMVIVLQVNTGAASRVH